MLEPKGRRHVRAERFQKPVRRRNPTRHDLHSARVCSLGEHEAGLFSRVHRIPVVKWLLGVSVLLLVAAPAAEASSGPVRIARYGVSITVPARWHGRIYERSGGLPILHVANFRLPANDDDFGTKATLRMGSQRIFIVLLESSTKTGFKHARPPIQIRRSDFLPRFKGVSPSHAFARRRFTTRNRRFSLWVQFGQRKPSNAMLSRANIVLGTLLITASRVP